MKITGYVVLVVESEVCFTAWCNRGDEINLFMRENLISVGENTSMPMLDSPLSLAHKILTQAMTSSALMYFPSC